VRECDAVRTDAFAHVRSREKMLRSASVLVRGITCWRMVSLLPERKALVEMSNLSLPGNARHRKRESRCYVVITFLLLF